MIRSFALLAAFTLVTRIGTSFGPVTLAANAVLMTIFLVAGYYLDGLATAAEQLTGRSIGAGYRPAFDRVLRMTALWSLGLAALTTLALLAFGNTVVNMTSLSLRATAAPESGIVEVVNYARGREGLIPLWVGEGDLPTPDFVSRAAADALMAGETFYPGQRGIPPLREALVRYYQRRFQKALSPENFYVTGSGMQAIKLAIEAVGAPGDEVVLLTPAWPNFAAAADLSSVRPVAVPLQFEGGKWQLDPERLQAAIGERTRALFINTPSNPTGWTATHDDLKAILALARKHGAIHQGQAASITAAPPESFRLAWLNRPDRYACLTAT